MLESGDFLRGNIIYKLLKKIAKLLVPNKVIPKREAIAIIIAIVPKLD